MSNKFENNYPAGYSFFPEMYNHIDPVDHTYFSGLHTEIDNIEKTLGLNPQGDYSTVADRLATFVSSFLFYLSEYLYAPGGNIYKDIMIRDGKSLYTYGASSPNHCQLYHDGSHGHLHTNVGNLYVNPAGTLFLQAHTYLPSGYKLYAYDASNTKFASLYHDGSDGWIASSFGALKLTSQNNIKIYADIYKYNGKITYNFDASNTKSISNYHDGTDGYITTSSGKIRLNSATDVWIESALRQYGSAGIFSYDDSGVDNLWMYHNGVDGTIATNAGKILLNPNTTIDANNKHIENVGELTHKAQSDGAKVRFWQAAGATGEWINLHFQNNATSTWRFRDKGQLYVRKLYDCWNFFLDDQYPGTPTTGLFKMLVTTSPGIGLYCDVQNSGADGIKLKGLSGAAQCPVLNFEEGYIRAQTGGNRMFGTATITNGTNSVTVTPTIASATSLIYVTAQSGDMTKAYNVNNRGVQTFDIVASGNVVGDTVIAYWIINTY